MTTVTAVTTGAMVATMAGVTTTAARTTDRPRLPGLSVRNRITLFVTLLTLVAMATAGTMVYALESARIDREVSQDVDQEILEFRQMTKGVDPATGQPFTDVEALLSTFLARNVPDDDEMLVAYLEGQQPLRTRNRHGEAVLSEPAYEQALSEIRDTGGTREFTSKEYGEVWLSVVPVRNDTSSGALAIVSFVDDEHAELNRTMRTYALVALLSLGLIALLAAVQSGRLLAPLRTLRQTASDITSRDLSRRMPEVGNDDITALTRTFNDMLDRVEAGFESQRQFLDDAGHELRTPLTVLSGHLELVDPEDAEEVRASRALLLDEVDRMSRLVGDMLLLAKARRPDFLATGPVDLDQLTHALLGKARVLADRRWRLDQVAIGTATMDEQRITQAMLQLADNAVKHTDPGAEIAIGTAFDDGTTVEGGTVRLWVRDSGDGVPEADRHRIFERFGRSTVREDDPGFGLGLSIVAAIAEAHGGAVTVEPADEDPAATRAGARFVITLPVRRPEEED